MANTTSARKAARKIARRTAVNKARRSRMRTVVRKVEEAIARLEGIDCRGKGTSCPDQLARALRGML